MVTHGFIVMLLLRVNKCHVHRRVPGTQLSLTTVYYDTGDQFFCRQGSLAPLAARSTLAPSLPAAVTLLTQCPFPHALRLTDEWNALRGRHALGQDQLEDCERQEHGDAQRHLFPRVSGQVEGQWRQQGDEHTGQQQVAHVGGSSAAQQQSEGHIWVGLGAAAIGEHAPARRHAQHVPLNVLHKVGQAGRCAPGSHVQLVTAVSP